jgi:hypothetical protein
MKLYSYVFICLIIMMSFACARGPSDEEVISKIETAMEGFNSVPYFSDDIAESFAHNDSAEGEFANDASTIKQEMQSNLDRTNGILTVNGVCTFENYQDARSNIIRYGTITYQISGNVLETNADMDLSFDYDLAFTGGKVRKIIFSVDQDSFQNNAMPDILVNNKKFTPKEQALAAIFGNLKKGASLIAPN